VVTIKPKDNQVIVESFNTIKKNEHAIQKKRRRLPLGDSEGTISFWFKTNEVKNMVLISDAPEYRAKNEELSLWFLRYVLMTDDKGSEIDFQFGTDFEYDSEGITAPLNYADGTWHHIVWSFNKLGKNFYGYVDGQLVEKTWKVKGILASSYDPTLLGGIPGHEFKDGNGTDFYFNGEIDDLRFYNKALTPEEIYPGP
jgi:hypothetical protein